MKKLITYLKKKRYSYIIGYNINQIFIRICNILHYGYKLENAGIYFKTIFDMKGNNIKIQIGKNSIIRNTKIYVRGNNNFIVIKQNVRYLGGELWIEGNNNKIVIENSVTIEEAHIAVTGIKKEIVIGEDSMLSNQITLRTGDSHAIINEFGFKINNEGNINVGKHVWLGNGVTVLKAVNIGDNCIIGTKSLVTKSLPSNSMAAGIPAVIIKNNINWTRDNLYINEKS